MHRLDRGAERRIDRLRQAGAVVQRLEAGAAAIMYQRRDTPGRQAGELGERDLEEIDVAGEQRAQHQSGGELAGLAQMVDQRRGLLAGAARMTVAFSQASCAMRCARPSSIQLRATTKPASVSDSLITSAWRVAAGRSGQPSSASRIAARCPKRATIRSSENCAMSAPAFSISVRHASAPPTSAIAAATERGR